MNSKKNKIDPEKVKPFSSNDHSGTDTDSDHSGSDCDNDKTETGAEPDSNASKRNKFDKPKREKNPDRTGIDINSDKIKKENLPPAAPAKVGT